MSTVYLFVWVVNLYFSNKDLTLRAISWSLKRISTSEPKNFNKAITYSSYHLKRSSTIILLKIYYILYFSISKFYILEVIIYGPWGLIQQFTSVVLENETYVTTTRGGIPTVRHVFRPLLLWWCSRRSNKSPWSGKRWCWILWKWCLRRQQPQSWLRR